MRRFAPFVLVLLILSACGGGSDDTSPVPAAPADTASPPATASGPAPLDVGIADAVCGGLADWIAAVAFGGATDDIYDRVASSAGALDAPYGPSIAGAVGGGRVDYAQASELDLETLSLCEFPVVEGALLAALHGQPDCYLDQNRDIVASTLCDFGGPPQTVGLPVAVDAAFCGTVQDFLRRGAGSATGQGAIDELNAFVNAAPAAVERPARDVVGALTDDNTDGLLRASFDLDRTVAWSCDDHVAEPYVALARAAIDAVPAAAPAPAPGAETPSGPGEVAGGSPYVALCEGIEARFVGSSAREWGLVLDMALAAGAPGDVTNILTQLANPDVKGDEARAPLVAALQPFVNGPCQDTGLDQGGSNPSDRPPDDGSTEDPDEDDDIGEMI